MNTTLNDQTIKKLIKQELPGLMKKDRKIREWILLLTKEQLTEKANEIETKTEGKFERLLEELKRDREEQARKWEENQKEIRKLFDVVEKNREESSQKLSNAFSALGARWGLRTESSFRNGLKGILEDLGLVVEHIDVYDKEGMVYGWPSSVEIDVIIKNGLLMICELKSSMSKADMFIFYKKALFYEKKYQRKGDRLIVISPMVNDKASKVAVELGIKVYSYAEDVGKDL